LSFVVGCVVDSRAGISRIVDVCYEICLTSA